MMVTNGISPFKINNRRYALVQYIDTQISEYRNHNICFCAFIYAYTPAKKEEVAELITMRRKDFNPKSIWTCICICIWLISYVTKIMMSNTHAEFHEAFVAAEGAALLFLCKWRAAGGGVGGCRHDR